MYYFSIYHWRKHLRSIALLGIAAALIGVALVVPPPGRLVTAVVALGIGAYGAKGIGPLFRPRPWSLDQRKYDALADVLPAADGKRVLDVGCGTGRSLVGLAPALRTGDSITAVDRFDDRIILGNTPKLADRNAGAADLDVTFVTGDATDLPFDDDAYDLVTVGMMLHDLPEEDIRGVLAELRRVCAPDGTLGLLELPIVDDRKAVPPEFWRDLVADSGFEVRAVRTRPWKDGRSYTVLAAAPESRPSTRAREGESVATRH